MSDVWERHAEWWQRGFTQGADPEYVEQILPLAATWLAGYDRVLDLGCGEGQIARLAHDGGAGHVLGIDLARNQIATARRRGGGPHYVVSDAAALPVGAGSFDAVVTSLVLEHLDDLDEVVAEIARVVRPGGRYVLFLNHPFVQTPGSGWIDDQVIDPPEQYWRVGPYLVEDYRLEEVDNGVRIGFHHRPLSRYLNALADVGWSLRHMVEPAPPPGFVARAPEYDGITDLPRLLVLILTRVDPGAQAQDRPA